MCFTKYKMLNNNMPQPITIFYSIENRKSRNNYIYESAIFAIKITLNCPCKIVVRRLQMEVLQARLFFLCPQCIR